ncbi:hydroxymethylbilane synthase, partial [Candidatus Pelagibacter sp.]|nr:hydroxymethylbilane synthase [Candidatus Pelagibacter sp.]
MKSKNIIIGSRGSKLALIYAETAKRIISENYKDFNIEIKKITTDGDLNTKDRLSDIGGKGLFSKKIEQELQQKKIDLAVHALKDMPSEEPEDLLTNCFLERNDPREILISKKNLNLYELPSNAVVGTSSFRREFQLKQIRKDLNFKLIRGNVDTRLKKLNSESYDAIILSYAGLKSLNLKNNISQFFSVSEVVPSAGQGVVALQCRKTDSDLINLLNKINHLPTHNCITAERSVLKILQGDCETAVGANAFIEGKKITLSAELFSLDGSKRFFQQDSKDLSKSR